MTPNGIHAFPSRQLLRDRLLRDWRGRSPCRSSGVLPASRDGDGRAGSSWPPSHTMRMRPSRLRAKRVSTTFRLKPSPIRDATWIRKRRSDPCPHKQTEFDDMLWNAMFGRGGNRARARCLFERATLNEAWSCVTGPPTFAAPLRVADFSRRRASSWSGKRNRTKARPRRFVTNVTMPRQDLAWDAKRNGRLDRTIPDPASINHGRRIAIRCPLLTCASYPVSRRNYASARPARSCTSRPGFAKRAPSSKRPGGPGTYFPRNTAWSIRIRLSSHTRRR